jgi:hypothetical protein
MRYPLALEEEMPNEPRADALTLLLCHASLPHPISSSDHNSLLASKLSSARKIPSQVVSGDSETSGMTPTHRERDMTSMTNYPTWIRSILGVSLGLALITSVARAGENSIRASGSGQGTAAQFVTYVGVDGVLRDVPSVATTGNQFSFGFTASRDRHGNVAGQMQLTDHTTGMRINSNVAILEINGTHAAPHGEDGFSLRMVSSMDSVIIDGVAMPGWEFVNSPTWDGGPHGADTVCFELFDAGGERILQWSAFVTAGNIKITGGGDDDG